LLPQGFKHLVDLLHSQSNRRSKRDRCYYRVKLERTVRLVVQTTDVHGAPCAMIFCPEQQEVYVAHFVVCTASLGILQNSVRYCPQLSAQHHELLARLGLEAQASYAAVSQRGPPTPPQAHQLQASMLFYPPLSDPLAEAIESLGMGCENKAILVFPPGSRFWPRHVHQLRSAVSDEAARVRFYNLGGIRDDDCSILICHLSPPLDQKLGRCNAAQAQDLVMSLLVNMLDTATEGAERDGLACPSSDDECPRAVEDNWSADDFASTSDEELEERWRVARDRRRRRGGAKKEKEEAKHASHKNDKWRTRPVVKPSFVLHTQWRSDPFAQGAYSFSEFGTALSSVASAGFVATPDLTSKYVYSL
jgi:hypothetical protein